MKLTNIHDRKEFLKLNELIGGQSGGVGEKDGFANNAKLKDTYLGALVNGIFKGVSWLWRKSKENFIINRLIAQLINELMRGVILFCFVNKINLETGETSTSAEAVKGETDDAAQQAAAGVNVVSASGTTSISVSPNPISGITAETQQLTVLNQNNEDVTIDCIYTGATTTGLVTFGATGHTTVTVVHPEIATSPVVVDIEVFPVGTNLPPPPTPPTLSATTIASGTTTTASGTTTSGSTVSTPKGYKPRLVERIKAVKDRKEYFIIEKEAESRIAYDTRRKNSYVNQIKIRETNLEKKIVPKEKIPFYNSEIKRVREEISKIKVYNLAIEEAIETKRVELGIKKVDRFANFDIIKKDLPTFSPTSKTVLPELQTIGVVPYNRIDVSKIGNVESESYNFLKTYINEYEKTTDPNLKKKLQLIYMQYAIINYAKSVVKRKKNESFSEDEDYEFLYESSEYYEINEENLVRSVGKSLGQSAGTVKLKQDEPRAGKVGLAKSVGMKVAGISATVGNILTKRDRDRYEKDHKDEYKLNIHSVNLAGIENTVTTFQKSNPKVKTDVSSYVNPYSLKIIQLSAEKLFLSNSTATKNEAVDNSQLKLRWEREVNKVYAGFTNLMDIDSIDITKSDFRSNLNSKLNDKVDGAVNRTKFEIAYSKVDDDLPIDPKHYKIHQLEGYYGIFYFQLGSSYMTSMAPVQSVPGLFRITSSFTSINKTSHTIVEDGDFKNKFFNSRLPVNANKRNLYFLLQKDEKLPDTQPRKGPKMYVLTEVEVGGKVSLYIKQKGTDNILITDTFMKTFEPKLYAHTIELNKVSLFDRTKNALLDMWKPAFKYVESKGKFENTNFMINMGDPLFLSEPNMADHIKNLQIYLRNK